MDSFGDGCEWYLQYYEYCGWYDTNDFIATEMCCVCQAAEHEDASDWEVNHDWYDNCENSANGATDSYGDGCEWYDEYRDGCGYYDTDDFISFEMCCACSVDYSDWEDDWFDDFEDDDWWDDFDDEDWWNDSGDEYSWYDSCENSAGSNTDSHGDGCEWYDDYQNGCGFYDTLNFVADEVCCACSVANSDDDDWWVEPQDDGGDGGDGDDDESSTFCLDRADGATDSYGDGCEWYDDWPSGCGYYDDDDFNSYEMCCACEGDRPEEIDEFVEIFDSEASEVEYEALSAFEEDDWEHFVEEDVDWVDPTVDWTEIADYLEDFQATQWRLDMMGENECDDIAHHFIDNQGRGCQFYTDYPASCGDANTEEFIAEAMCCACGGGTSGGGMC
jgi:hypothetical protein